MSGSSMAGPEHGHQSAPQPPLRTQCRILSRRGHRRSGRRSGRSVVYDGMLSDPNTYVNPVNAVGGWAQFKFGRRPSWNSTAHSDKTVPSPPTFAISATRYRATLQPISPPTAVRFGNVIYRPRSDLLFSMEYRRLRTFTIYDDSYDAGQLNLSVGVLF